MKYEIPRRMPIKGKRDRDGCSYIWSCPVCKTEWSGTWNPLITDDGGSHAYHIDIDGVELNIYHYADEMHAAFRESVEAHDCKQLDSDEKVLAMCGLLSDKRRDEMEPSFDHPKHDRWLYNPATREYVLA